MKLISEMPPQIECNSCEATLEDAYIYIVNKESISGNGKETG